MLSYLQSFFNLIYPKSCLGCGNPLLRNEKLLCVGCQIELPINPEINLDNNTVKVVFSGRLPLESASTFLIFSKGGITQHLIHALKYQDRQDLGYYLGQLFGAEIASSFSVPIDYVIPVPLHPKKEALRGYNQCNSIANGLALALNCTVLNTAVERTLENPSQTKLNRAKRWDNVKGIFELKEPELIKNKHLLLVDDTLTTGATLESCGLELLKAEGIKLSIATLAHAK